jgi:triphosphoribosyl-dephospho-CoA synthase
MLEPDMPSQKVARAFIEACELELAAPKPGNVHIYAGGHGMEAKDFVESARAAAPFISAAEARVGRRILDAVEATWARVGCNTNLGIILLCAPLAHAALREGEGTLREKLIATLDALDRDDADLAFRAILRAAPAGLGAAPQHDVAGPATIGLREAMALAAERDRVALQYVTGFADIFGLGLETIARSRARGDDRTMTTLRLFMGFASRFPDSHIGRKFGAETARSVMERMSEADSRLEAIDDREQAISLALEFDRNLKKDGYNPGTSADLAVAALFVDSLLAILPNVHKNG